MAEIVHASPKMRIRLPMRARTLVPDTESQMLKWTMALVLALDSRSIRAGPVGFQKDPYADLLKAWTMSEGRVRVSVLTSRKYGALLIFR